VQMNFPVYKEVYTYTFMAFFKRIIFAKSRSSINMCFNLMVFVAYSWISE